MEEGKEWSEIDDEILWVSIQWCFMISDNTYLMTRIAATDRRRSRLRRN